MNTALRGGALALSTLICASSAWADDAPLSQPDAHAPPGVMADHVHKAGEVMIGLTWMHEEADGPNHRGTAELTDSEVVAAGYAARTQAMRMDMAMLHIMYAPSGRVTLMLMPTWQTMEMTMIGIAPATGGHHGLAVGETMAHRVSGIGDTQIGALVALSRNPTLSAHAGLALSIPTGSVSRKDEDGNFVHYGMQPGSGTWDLIPSFTVRGRSGGVGWGAQLGYVFRAEEANASGFRFGDRLTATGWLSRPFGERFSLSGRLTYVSEGTVKGHYNAGHNHASPPDRQANYGGDRFEAGLGANLLFGDRMTLGLEASLPLIQRVNGVQPPHQFATSMSVSRKF